MSHIDMGGVGEGGEEVVEELLAEYNEELRVKGHADHSCYLNRCPKEHREELLSLMNTLSLAFSALAPFREHQTRTVKH